MRKKKIEIVKSPSVEVEINMIDDVYCGTDNVYLVPEGLKLVNCIDMREHDELILKYRSLKVRFRRLKYAFLAFSAFVFFHLLRLF